MFKLKELELKVQDVELIKSDFKINDELVEDTYSVFIGAMNEEEQYSVEFYTTVPRKTFYEFDLNKKVLINNYVDNGDIHIQSNNEYEFVDLEKSTIYLTRLDDTLFEIEITTNIESSDSNNVYIKTKIDFEKDAFKGEE